MTIVFVTNQGLISNACLKTLLEGYLKLLEDDGWLVVPPDEGMQACQTIGPGRLPEPENLLQAISDQLD